MGSEAQQQRKARSAHALLLVCYGTPLPKERRDPLSELVLTILSQNTSDTNTGRAYATLRQRFPTWEQVLAVDEREVADAIRSGGLANVKAPRIQAILRQLQAERGALSLDFIGDLPTEQARAYLTSLHGVGAKTAACVLLFSLHQPALPVDTHVLRVARRVGMVRPRAGADEAQRVLEQLLSIETYYPFHLNVIHLGRTLCRPTRPRCPECPLAELCGDYAARQPEGTSADDSPGA